MPRESETDPPDSNEGEETLHHSTSRIRKWVVMGEETENTTELNYLVSSGSEVWFRTTLMAKKFKTISWGHEVKNGMHMVNIDGAG